MPRDGASGGFLAGRRAVHSGRTACALATASKLTQGVGMHSDEQRGLARSDGRDAEGPEVIGDTQPLTSPVPAAPPDPWGQPSGDPWIDVTPGDPTTETVGPAPEGRRRSIGGAVGLLAA